jgi:hypothetical protein
MLPQDEDEAKTFIVKIKVMFGMYDIKQLFQGNMVKP